VPADSHVTPRPDWYVDPDDPSRGRYWDGDAWTSDVVDIPDGLTLALFPRRTARRQRQSRSRAVLVAASVVGVAAVAGVAGWWATGRADSGTRVAGTSVIRLRGSIDLEDPSFIGRDRGAPCEGTGEVDDVVAGLTVTVRSPNGSTLAVTQLRPGRLVALASDLPEELGNLIPTCRLPFECEVQDASRYEVEVEGYGAETWTRDELEDAGWTARMSVTG
jgi:hypothetical protein